MARMTFSGNTLSSPVWAGDFLDRECLVPGGAKLLASDFSREDAFLVSADGSAAQGATSMAVDALGGALPSGTILTFGSGEFAKLTASAAAGATSLTVEALPNALEDNDTATYAGVGAYAVRSGTLIGRTYAERTAGTAFGPWASGDDEAYLVVYDVPDVTINNDVELLRHGTLVKENFLPTATQVAAQIAVVRAAYQTTRGVA